MSRRVQFIKRQKLEYTYLNTVPSIDTYFDKVVKYIPADIVGAWIAVTGLIKSADDTIPKVTLLWIAFSWGVFFTIIWTWKQTQELNKPLARTQIIISTIAFIVWAYALGEPFESVGFYKPIYGSLLLILYTLTVALINPKIK
ncbi:MAG: hypothetical protein ACFB02_18380 [Mastigocoleus sp.]